ncbi:MAG: hypothetical protein AABY22_08445 [Nanoarchaeota archaeon]
MPNLRPFRDIDDHDVINLYSFSGTYPVNKGTFVKVVTTGWSTSQEIEELGNVGAAWTNVVSQRYGVQAKVAACNNSGDAAVGMLLYDGKEVDENGEKLIFHKEKQYKLQCFLSGQAAPFATRGTFLYSGVVGTVTAGGNAYVGQNGELNATNSGTATLASIGTVTRVGRFLGTPDVNNWVLFKLEL